MGASSFDEDALWHISSELSLCDVRALRQTSRIFRDRFPLLSLKPSRSDEQIHLHCLMTRTWWLVIPFFWTADDDDDSSRVAQKRCMVGGVFDVHALVSAFECSALAPRNKDVARCLRFAGILNYELVKSRPRPTYPFHLYVHACHMMHRGSAPTRALALHYNFYDAQRGVCIPFDLPSRSALSANVRVVSW